MLHKSKSKKINLLKYVLVLPLLALFLMGFNTKEVYVAKVLNENIQNKKTAEAHAIKNNNKDLLENEKPNHVNSENIKILFNKDLTDNDLKNIEKKLKKLNIVFTYSDLERNQKGEISKLKTKFESDGGYCTSNAYVNPIESFYFFKNEKVFGVSRIENENKKQPYLKNSLNQETLKPFRATITKDFTDADFNSIIKKGKEHGVTLKFSKIKRNSKNEITSIHAEFKNKNGSGNYNLNGNDPIKTFVYEQNNDGFGFGKPMQNIHVIGYDDFKFKEGNKVVVSDTFKINSNFIISKTGKLIDTIHSKNKNNFVFITTDSIHFAEKKHIISSDSIFFNKTNTIHDSMVIGRPYIGTLNFSTSLNSNEKPPLFILDDKKVTSSHIKTISPDKIHSINVLKGDEAKTHFGKEGENGVVIISTKKDWETKFTIGKPFNRTDQEMKKTLLIVDGKEVKNKAIDNIDVNTIESINVLKEENAIKKYGKKGKNGVIEITTKDAIEIPTKKEE